MGTRFAGGNFYAHLLSSGDRGIRRGRSAGIFPTKVAPRHHEGGVLRIGGWRALGVSDPVDAQGWGFVRGAIAGSTADIGGG